MAADPIVTPAMDRHVTECRFLVDEKFAWYVTTNGAVDSNGELLDDGGYLVVD